MNRFLRTEIGLSVFFFLLFPFFLLAGTTESAPLRDVLPQLEIGRASCRERV